MATNPYAAFLGDRQPSEVMDATAGRLQMLLARLGPDRAERAPAPGKWSARQILCHLADCEIVFAFRLRQALAEDCHVIQPFDQDRWAAQYGAFDAGSALAVFTAVRSWNVRLIAALPAASMDKKLTHPERGDMTFRVVLETIAGHDLNHLGQIEGIAGHARIS
jgi:uncharacterized damage-inducible protein DinB